MAVNFFENNPWVGYVDRSYLQMKQQIIAKIQNPITGIPEITDHSESNPWIKRVSIWVGIGEQLGYYIDNRGREAFLLVARLFRSIVNIAKQYDYRIRGRIAGSGQAKFYFDNPTPVDVTIPKDTIISTEDGIVFITMADVVILAATTEIVADIKQLSSVALYSLGLSTGLPNQTFELNEKVADGTISVIVNTNQPFNAVESFVLTTYNEKAFKAQLNVNGKVEIVFGDSINGEIPANTKDISVRYSETLGALGNVGANLITTLVSAIAVPGGYELKVINDAAITGGTDIESITSLKKLIPLSLRTLYRAVTEQDYIDVAELAPGVAKAGVSYSCGKYVDLYIAPNGGGLASTILCDETKLFMDDRKMIATFVRVSPAGLVVIEYELEITAYPNVYNSQAQADVIAALTDFHAVQNQDINGKVFIGDIYQLIEGLSSVRHSEVLMMRARPYARPLDPSYPALVWTRTQTPNSTNAVYRLTFTSATQYNLLRNNVFIGSYAAGALVSTPDVDLQVTGIYVAGNSYEFKTYVISGSVELNEPSLPAFDPAFLTISVTGGLV
jgi:hypothetical protein